MGPLTLLSTLTIAAPLRDLKQRFEGTTGIALEIELGPTMLLMQRLAAGASPDVIALSKEKIDELAANGTLAPGSAVDHVRSTVGIGVKAGAPKPAIGTVDELKAAVLKARCVCFSRAGASGLHFAALIKRLGIEDEVRARAIIIPEGFTGEAAASGEADLAVQQISELMNVPGVDVVGPLPREVESRAVFSLGVMASSARKDDAATLIRFLSSRDVEPMMRHYGLDLLPGA